MILNYLINLFDYSFFKIAISDLALLFLNIYSFLKLKKIHIQKYYILLVFFIFLTLLSSIININKIFFSKSEFLLSYFKLLFYFLSIILLPNLFSLNYSILIKILKRSLYILCLLGIYQLIVHKFFPNLPYNFKVPFISLDGGYKAMYSYNNQFRIKSIFSEPAHFSIYINVIYAYLLHYKHNLRKRLHGLVIISTFLSFSLSGIVLLLTNFILLFGNIFDNKRITITILIFFLLFSILVFQNDYIIYRMDRLSSLSEYSSADRLLGSWELAFNAPFYGVGVGNIVNYNKHSNFKFKFVKPDRKVHNIFAAILSSSGLLGLIMFLIFYFILIRKNFKFGIFLFISGFAWGKFNATPFWFFLILVSTYNYYLKISSVDNYSKNIKM